MELKLVSEKLAKKLKEAGFDEECDHYIDNADRKTYKFKYYHFGRNYSNKEECVVDYHLLLPTLELAKMWMWEKHKIWIETTLWGDGIGFTTMLKYHDGKDDDGSTTVIGETAFHSLYHQEPHIHLEQGLLQACELIKKK